MSRWRGEGPAALRRVLFLDRFPLLLKLAVPGMLMAVLLGVGGTVATAQYLSASARSRLYRNQERRALVVQAAVRDDVSYLLEATTHTANLDGMAAAVVARTPAGIGQLALGVAAVRARVGLLVVTDAGGRVLWGFDRTHGPAGGGDTAPETAAGWSSSDVVRAAVAGDKRSGIVSTSGVASLAVGGPIMAGGRIVGTALAGITMADVTAPLAATLGAGVASYGSAGELLGSAGRVPTARPPRLAGNRPIERNGSLATLYFPLDLGAPAGRPPSVGTLAVSVPRQAFLSWTSGAALRLVLVVLGAIVAVALLSMAVSRAVVHRINELASATTAFGSGELSARAAVEGHDELTVLSGRFNDMADQLAASQRELERRVAERTEELQHLYDEAQTVLRSRDELFASISHEFRTPIFAILGHAEMMLDPSGFALQPGWEREFGETIKSSGEQLAGRVNDILELARVHSEGFTVHPEDVDLEALLREVAPTMKALATTRQIDLSVHVPDHLPSVRADRARLGQVVLNLASNAVKYTPSGGSVRIAASAEPKGVVVSVSDTGVGIPAEVGELVFEPFYRIARSDVLQPVQASSGLGLSITRRLVEAQGGTIWFESMPGKGTTFRVRLPMGAGLSSPNGVSHRRAPRRRSAGSALGAAAPETARRRGGTRARVP